MRKRYSLPGKPQLKTRVTFLLWPINISKCCQLYIMCPILFIADVGINVCRTAYSHALSARLTVESDLRHSGKQRNSTAKNCGVSASDKCGGISPVMCHVVPILQ